jgi:hypothetical protein
MDYKPKQTQTFGMKYLRIVIDLNNLWIFYIENKPVVIIHQWILHYDDARTS